MKITLQNLQTQVPIRNKKIKKIIRKVLKGEGQKKSGQINICFVNDSQIKKFNLKFLKTNRPTDVLAFNLSDLKKKDTLLADIMVSAQTAVKQSRNFKTSLDYELSLYVAHGILHILGFNDQSLAQAKLMRKKENLYVNR